MGCCASKNDDDLLEVQRALPAIGMPAQFRGSRVEIDSGDALVIGGTGAAMASAPIEQVPIHSFRSQIPIKKKISIDS